MSAPLPFTLTKKQYKAQLVLGGTAVHIMLFGGSRSGKTFLLVRAAVVRALKASGSRHVILRFRFNHVKNSVVLDTFPKVMKLCFPDVTYHLDKTDWYARMPNGAEIWFGGLDDKERTEKILGMEFVTIYLNECSQISRNSKDMVITRLAQHVMVDVDGVEPFPLFPKMYYDCNPPSKGHWTYKTFIKKVDPESRQLVNNPKDYAYFKINPKDNKENISGTYIQTLENLPARLRKRFLDGDFSEAIDNALFNDALIDMWRVTNKDSLPDMVKIVVAVDPSGSGDTDNLANDEIGITVCGLGVDGVGYVLEDITVKAGPATWGKVAVNAYERHEANCVVGEVNFGGAMVEHVIRTASEKVVPFTSVTASRGKHIRAEPIAALYEQGRIKHAGYFTKLEDEMVNMTTAGYIGEGSPNRIDSMVWGMTDIFEGIVAPVEKVTKFQRPQKKSRWG